MKRANLRGAGVLVAVALAATPIMAPAEPPGRDPDWPCVQRLVPNLAAGTFWSGPAAPAGADWRADPRLADLVAAVASRDLPVADGDAKLSAYADSLAPEQRRTVLPKLFAALVDEINDARHDTIVRLKELARRQKSVAALVGSATDQLRAVPADATGEDAARRTEIEQRRDFLIRTFQQTQRTVQYACQVPNALEARLGSYARTLQAKL